MTGNIGKPGTGANSLTGQTNAMGSRLFSNTTALHGGGEYNDQAERERIADIFGVTPDYLAKKPTLPYDAIVEGVNSGKIKGLWIICTNPRHSWTNNKTFMEAVEKLELFVVQDLYDDTETSELASVFFPVVPGIKKEGTIINTERRLSPVRPVVSKTEDERTDQEVFLGVAEKLGMDISRWNEPRKIFEMMKQTSRQMPCDITGVEWDELTRSKGVQWPFPEGAILKEDERRLYEDGQFITPDGRANFIFEEPLENPMPTTEEFPTVFNTGRSSAAAWHTRSRTREISANHQVNPDNAYVVMGPLMAEELNVTEEDRVMIYSSNGEQASFDVQIFDRQRNDEVFAPIHYIECNQLTASIYDPYSKEPAYKSAPVRVEKWGVSAV